MGGIPRPAAPVRLKESVQTSAPVQKVQPALRAPPHRASPTQRSRVLPVRRWLPPSPAGPADSRPERALRCPRERALLVDAALARVPTRDVGVMAHRSAGTAI